MTRKGTVVRILETVVVLALALGLHGCSIDAAGLGCGDDPSCMPPPEQSSPNSYTCSCTCKPDSTVYDMRVTAGDDDAEQDLNTGAVLVNGIKLDFPFAGVIDQLVGMRFADLAIPQGAHIVSAHIQFTSAADQSGAVSVTIAGEASDNAASFASTANNLSSRQFTNNSASWSLPDWKKDDQGTDQQTPGLEKIVQEIVGRPGWVPGNALVLMIKKDSGNGSRGAYSFEAQPENAPVLVVTYDDPKASVGPQDMAVCMPPSLNANLDGKNPMQDDLQDDCQYRVGATFVGLAEACNYPSNCGCVAIANTKTYSEKCDDPCVENPVAPDCKNFDPVHNVVEATNAPGDNPVCIANCPLSFGMFGRRSECLVEGTAHMSMAGEQVDPSVTGVVQFRGDPCPEGNCPVGMEYDLDIADVRFETLFGSEVFEELTGIGESVPGREALLSRRGDGTFAPGDLVTSARGRRGREQQALSIGNHDPIAFNVKFGSEAPTCAIHGRMVGGSDAAGAPTLELGLDLQGAIVNQPPTADAGKDQIVQCPKRVVLDGSASSDLDGNIAVYSWLRGSRAGNKVGVEKVSQIEQRPGKETYVLRVIDTRGQTDEDSTEVTVIDTRAPQVSCGVRVPVLSSANRSMADVGLSGAARDACEGALPVKVDVFSDEDDSAVSRDNLSPDAQNIALGSLQLRQERRSDGDGRVYLIRVAASDSSGNQGVDCCTVVVPHSSSPASLVSAQKQANAARSFCLAHQGAAPSGFFPVRDKVNSGR